MRGTLRLRLTGFFLPGIIPAHAGNTGVPFELLQERGDHPRACGEHITGNADDAVKAGSSPRMRGTRRNSCRRVPTRRIIPAHAGNTLRD